MVDTVKFLDPVQGLIDYVNDIKPYHTKIIEALVEYTGQETADTIIREDFAFDIGLEYAYDVPFNETYIAIGGENVVPTSIPTRSNLVFTGSPPIRVYDYNDTYVYVNGLLQEEAIGSPPNNDYYISGTNEITFLNTLLPGDEVKIYTFTQWQTVPTTCTGGGFGSLTFGYPDKALISSPDQTKTFVQFPAITSNTFIIQGDKREYFKVLDNITYNIESFTENTITGSKIIDPNNSGSFTVTNAVFVEGTDAIQPHTIVYIIGISLVLPTEPPAPSKYVSLVSIPSLLYTKVLSYSNTFTEYNTVGSPPTLLQTPDEGSIRLPITDVSAAFSQRYFTVSSNLRNSNIFAGDAFTVVGSTNNDGVYTISNISYDIPNNETKFIVTNAIDGTIDGDIDIYISANTFTVQGKYDKFFTQGTLVDVVDGSATGLYTVLNSHYIDGTTHIRVIESIFRGSGDKVVGTITSGVVVDGNLTAKYQQNSSFDIIKSKTNNGQYTVASSSYSSGTAQTTINITSTEDFDSTDITGELYPFNAGYLNYTSPGFGQIPTFCRDVPHTVIKIGLVEDMKIEYASGSPPVPMFIYPIINTTSNSITVHGDATSTVTTTVDIIYSGTISANNGTYAVTSVPQYDSVGGHTTFNVGSTINTTGNSGGWIEGYIT